MVDMDILLGFDRLRFSLIHHGRKICVIVIVTVIIGTFWDILRARSGASLAIGRRLVCDQVFEALAEGVVREEFCGGSYLGLLGPWTGTIGRPDIMLGSFFASSPKIAVMESVSIVDQDCSHYEKEEIGATESVLHLQESALLAFVS